MKVLVTGGAGFIGSHVVDRLVAEGHQVVVVDDLSTGREANVAPAARFYRLDIGSPELAEVFAAELPDIVNHHAAQVSVQASVRDPSFDARVNVLGALNVWECCRRYGVRKVVYASTGGAIYGEPKFNPCDETHPIQPLSPYGITKYTAELHLALYGQLFGLDYTILRYANVYGPRQDPFGEAGVVAIFIGQMLADRPVTINGSGDQERDFVYVSDVVEANLLALERGSGATCNIGTGLGASVNEIFRRLVAQTSYRQEPIHGPPVPGEVFKIALACEKAQQRLGWRPSMPLDEGLARTVAFFRERFAQNTER
ncbi:MAG: NAD-dependent epimerase/dehydratase family protein [Chloroflexi bacterium]|nr:NAD-dependent epimerase/dehydratase family protein [Chloroflexota bacterium]